MDYGVLIPIIAYFAGIYAVFKFDLKPLTGTLIAIGIPFVIAALVRWIIAGSRFSYIWGDAFTLTTLVVCLFQFFLMFFLLRYLKNTESITAHLVWGVLGFFLIVYLLPVIIMQFL